MNTFYVRKNPRFGLLCHPATGDAPTRLRPQLLFIADSSDLHSRFSGAGLQGALQWGGGLRGIKSIHGGRMNENTSGTKAGEFTGPRRTSIAPRGDVAQEVK